MASNGKFVSKEVLIALLTVVMIALYLVVKFIFSLANHYTNLPLLIALILGGVPLIFDLAASMWRRDFGADLLAGVSIITSVILGEYLAGTLVVLMLSGGKALEIFAVRRATFALQALAKRLPSSAHRLNKQTGIIDEVPLAEIKIGDHLVIYPHEVSPTDGVVTDGYGVMDEAYLTGEPFQISKAPGVAVISGAVNGENALTIEATKIAADSRYAKIMEVMRAAEQHKPHLRRLGDQLGAYYTPLALLIAGATWWVTDSAGRFLSVLVVATPCPLLIGIPVAIIGSISLAARRGIIIRDPAIMEQIETCRTVILDKTGTLTYGVPTLTEILVAEGFEQQRVLALAAAVEQYSKHPLATAILQAARDKRIGLLSAAEVSEPPGKGLTALVDGVRVGMLSRKQFLQKQPTAADKVPTVRPGLECVFTIDDCFAALFVFHDGPRKESLPFVNHLTRRHPFKKVMLVSGDKESEVRYMADLVGIKDVYFSTPPEQKVAIVRRETELQRTIFIGDGINDAPALSTATVGIALGQRSDVTAEAAGAVIMDNSLTKVDELFHISQRMRRIVLQTAVGGMALSVVGMGFAAGGWLPAVAGALVQEGIDLLAIFNSLRTSLPPKEFTDF